MMNRHQTYNDIAAAYRIQKQQRKVEVKKLGIVEHRNHNNKNENPNENKESKLKNCGSVCNSEGSKSLCCDGE